jgi:hypothetical protein
MRAAAVFEQVHDPPLEMSAAALVEAARSRGSTSRRDYTARDLLRSLRHRDEAPRVRGHLRVGGAVASTAYGEGRTTFALGARTGRPFASALVIQWESQRLC